MEENGGAKFSSIFLSIHLSQLIIWFDIRVCK